MRLSLHEFSQLKRLKELFPDLDTPDKALEEALHYDKESRVAGPGDSYSVHSARNREHIFLLAQLLEKEKVL